MIDKLRSFVRPLGLGRVLLKARVHFANSLINTRCGWPDLILCSYNAYGDALLLSTLVHEFSKRGIKRIAIATPRRELFLHNPNVYRIVIRSETQNREARGMAIQRGFSKLHFPHYSVPTETPGVMQSPREHIIAVMSREAGLTGKIELLPRLYLLEKEIKEFRPEKETIVVQSSIANAGWPILNKDWYPERMQLVVNELRKHFTILHVGLKSDPPLDGVIDLREKLNIREIAAMLSHARAYVGMVGFLMHLARAVDCPAVIIYGGREAPWQSGYSCNENIYSAVSCAPCWMESPCPVGRHCMDRIDVETVLNATRSLFERSGPLSVDSAVIR